MDLLYFCDSFAFFLPPFWIFSKKSMLNCKVDTDKLLDWKEKLSENPVEDENLRSPTKKEEDEQNNNKMEKAALVNVNNTDIALFKYGEKIIGWFSIWTSKLYKSKQSFCFLLKL